MSHTTRRGFIQWTGGGIAAAGAALSFGVPRLAGAAKQRVVVVGGGFAGAVAAKSIRSADASIRVTLIEQHAVYHACPLSNWVIAGFRSITAQKRGYRALKKQRIEVVIDRVRYIDTETRIVGTNDGHKFRYDRLIVAPGVDFKPLPGYDTAAMEAMPHAWKAGEQTVLLSRQLSAMKDGDPFILVVPPNPFRCPPGPYERASLVAHFLARHKPRSKVIILDANTSFSKRPLFVEGWTKLYGFGGDQSRIEWVPGKSGGRVTRVDAKTGTVHADNNGFEESHQSGCINVIPPQRAGEMARLADLTDESGWCPVHLNTFESKRHAGVFVIGDASAANGLPKSGYAANSEAKVAAAAVVAQLRGQPPGAPSYLNTCYSMLSPDYAISVAGVYRFDPTKPERIQTVSNAFSPVGAPLPVRKREALYNEGWYQNIMSDTFG